MYMFACMCVFMRVCVFVWMGLSMLYLLFISWFICSRKWCIDKVGVFHANQISMCLDPHLNTGWGWRSETNLSPPIKYLLTVPRRYFFCGSPMLFLSCVCYAFVRVCLLLPCGHLLGKGWPLGSRLWCLIVSLLLSNRYPGSGVVLDCIDSWSLPFFLLCVYFCVFHARGLQQCKTLV